MNLPPAVIVLAAGRGSRFLGLDHKLAQSLGASTVLGTTLRHATQCGLPVVVVTTAAFAKIASQSVAASDLVVLPEVGASGHGSLGMGYSIAAGVSARSNASGWVILPGDMPLIESATIRAVADQLSQHPIAYAQHKGRRGHPVGFSSELYSELVNLSGDEGARRLIARYPAFGLEVGDAGVLVDVDTEADLASVRGTQPAASAGAASVSS